MSKPTPTVQKWMSTNPTTIERTATLERAHALMRAEQIRHLPVVDGAQLVGVVSQRDLHLIETLGGVDVREVRVEEAMSSHPYVVAPNAPLDEVVAELAERKIGSAVVVQNAKVVGIFSTVDAMRAFAELMHTRLG